MEGLSARLRYRQCIGGVRVPKKPADEVVIHRIEFQDKERQMIDDFILGQNVESVAKSIKDLADGIDGLLTWSNLYIVATIIELYTGEEILIGTPNDVNDLLETIMTWVRTTRWTVPELIIPEGQTPPALLPFIFSLLQGINRASPL